MSYSSSSGSSKVHSGEYASNRVINDPQAQQLMSSVSGYLTNAFNPNSASAQASNQSGNTLSALMQGGGENPYLKETVQGIRQNAASDLQKAYSNAYANNQGLGEITKQKLLSDIVSQNQLEQNNAILDYLNQAWNSGQDRLIQAANAAGSNDPAASLGTTAAALITNLTNEYGYQPVTTSTEHRSGSGIKN